jgi:hypothetical protein
MSGHILKQTWTLLFSAVALVTLGCSEFSPLLQTPQLPPTATPQPSHLVVTTECDSMEATCYATVHVSAAEVPGRYRVELRVLDGIVFEPGAYNSVTPDGRVAIIENEQPLAAHEQVKIQVPYMLDYSTQLSGEYVLEAVGVVSNGAGAEVARYTATTKLFVKVQPATAITLLGNQTQFDQEFGRNAQVGTLGIVYAILLEPGAEPTSGKILVRVLSPQPDYRPTVALEARRGINFVTAPGIDLLGMQRVRVPQSTLGVIADGGSRVVEIPFVIDPAVSDGRYALTAALNVNGVEQTETCPWMVVIASAAANHTHKWLDTVAHPNPAGELQAAVTPAPPQENRAEASVLGKVPANPQSTPTPVPAVPLSSTPPVATSILVAAPLAEPAVNWEQRTGVNGNRWQIYQLYISQVAPISWEVFQQEVVSRNPHLEADGYAFYPDKVYWLPQRQP